MTGIVYLVGAGPGDPRLLTLRGAEVLRTADVVIHDRLAPSALLDFAPRRAEIVDAGKTPRGMGASQKEINRLMVERARAGRTVVRLKGGDPFVFGRGGEEALACAEAGVPFEVVPGVTSAIAAPALAGVPVTHRGLGSSFTVITARRAGGDDTDLARVATAADTVIVLMAAGRLHRICRTLQATGRPAGDPALAVQWAGTTRQRSVTSTLADLADRARTAGLGPPMTVVVGPVVHLAEALGTAVSDTAQRLDEALP
ncbi:MAG TPA: uroporphyrinogen-III C-methyltransferase [Actinomycetota bacterium]|nr:uroporphyrinogen-III C-methyltransferase [Actinomycetota bacterium]